MRETRVVNVSVNVVAPALISIRRSGMDAVGISSPAKYIDTMYAPNYHDMYSLGVYRNRLFGHRLLYELSLRQV